MQLNIAMKFERYVAWILEYRIL